MGNDNSPGHILRQLRDLIDRDLRELKDCTNEHGTHLHDIDLELERLKAQPKTNWERTIIIICTMIGAVVAIIRIWG